MNPTKLRYKFDVKLFDTFSVLISMSFELLLGLVLSEVKPIDSF